jgi:outer membrane protein assembly factor BamB
MRTLLTLGVALPVALLSGVSGSGRLTAADAAWPQWGGPRRNFMVESGALASSWPSSGPRRLWQRALGEGHSAIVSDGSRLYTMYRPAGLLSMIRRSQTETIVAIDPSNGKTLWEHGYDAPTEGLDFEFGAGPHSTPLIVGNRLYAMSTLKQLFALDTASGNVVWSHDLMKEYGAPSPGRGYSSSPIQYKNTVIVPAGGAGQSLMAFDLQSGAIAWKSGDYKNSPSSPILAAVDGQDQLIFFAGDAIRGLNPSNGAELWSHPHKVEWELNISTPVFGDGNRVLVSSAYSSGARLVTLAQKGGTTSVQEQWFQNRMRTHIGTIIRLGDFAIGSSGDFGPCPTVGIDLASGKILWQSRDFARSTFLYADKKLIILDEDGNLGLATPTVTGLNVIAKAPVLSNISWTTPTLVGTKLYLRDRKNVVALELGGS